MILKIACSPRHLLPALAALLFSLGALRAGDAAPPARETISAELAVEKLAPLVGRDLRVLADELGITVIKEGRVNKGWAGQTIERHLGLALDSNRAPDLADAELKIVPLHRLADGRLAVKESMAITMINPGELDSQDFEQSHLLKKLRRMVVVSRVFEAITEPASTVHQIATFHLDDPRIHAQVKSDYELARTTARTKGFQALNGRLGILIQPRTKGAGHGSTSRAFYARAGFVAQILGLDTERLK